MVFRNEKGHVTGCVSGRVDGFQRYTAQFDAFAIGQLMVDSVSSRDMPVVQACALIFAATYIVLNLLADIVAIVTNPRLLHPK